MEKLWIVRRRAANQLLVEGKRQEARALYQKIVAGSRAPQRLIRLTLALDTFLPPLARAVVKVKKQASYARPIFR